MDSFYCVLLYKPINKKKLASFIVAAPHFIIILKNLHNFFTFFVDGIRRLSVFTQKPHSSVSCLTNSKYLPYKLVPRPFSLNFLSKSQGQHGKTKKRQENDDLKDPRFTSTITSFQNGGLAKITVRCHKNWNTEWLKCYLVICCNYFSLCIQN